MRGLIVDIHTHLAPGIDDGARTLAESLQLLDLAAAEGIGVAVATPHVDDACASEATESILDKVQGFCEQVKGHAVQVVPGAELMVQPDLPAVVQRDPRLSYAGKRRYVLVEMPMSMLPLYAHQTLFELQVRGITPVIAHPERYFFVQQNPNRLYELLRTGALAQATAESLLLPRSVPARRTVEILIRCGMLQVIASDVHSPVERPFRLIEAVEIAGRWIGRAAAEAMITMVPSRILEGATVTTHPQPYKRFWKLTPPGRERG